MIKAKLYGCIWVTEKRVKSKIKELKEEGFKAKITGGSFSDIEIEVNLNVRGKTMKGFINDLERKIVKFDNEGMDIYSLIRKGKTILTEAYDFPKIRDLFYLTDEEFLNSYSYIKK